MAPRQEFSSATRNGRPWFVFYDKAAVGIAHFGQFMVPFQPSNEAEQLLLQGTPWNYKEFPSRQAAEAWINSPAGKKIRGLQKDIPSNPVGGLTGIGDFFGRLTEANTWLRIGEFAVGGILLYIGLKGLFPQAVNTVVAPVKKVAKTAKIAAAV